MVFAHPVGVLHSVVMHVVSIDSPLTREIALVAPQNPPLEVGPGVQLSLHPVAKRDSILKIGAVQLLIEMHLERVE